MCSSASKGRAGLRLASWERTAGGRHLIEAQFALLFAGLRYSAPLEVQGVSETDKRIMNYVTRTQVGAERVCSER